MLRAWQVFSAAIHCEWTNKYREVVTFFCSNLNSFSLTNTNQNEEIVGTVPMGYKYSRFRVSSKREKCPAPRVETAAGKRQTRESQVT